MNAPPECASIQAMTELPNVEVIGLASGLWPATLSAGTLAIAALSADARNREPYRRERAWR
jgi:hypothetical protein